MVLFWGDYMEAGKLNKRVTIQAPVTATDSSGAPNPTWVDIATVSAAIEPLRGREFFSAQQANNELSHRVTIRYRRGIKPSYRLMYGIRYLEIESIIDPEERNRELQLMCKELV